MTNVKKFDIYERALNFAIRVAKFINSLPKNPPIMEYGKQVIRSSGSVGANIGEADGALTRRDFINKIGIARRESRESHHWLRLIKEVETADYFKSKKELNWLLSEAHELVLILSSIINKTQKKE